MKLLDKDLLLLNRQGFIPGPKESLDRFSKRIENARSFAKNPSVIFVREKEKPPFSLDQRVAYHDWEWPLVHIQSLYDISPDWLVGYYQNEKLNFSQGAQTWIFETPSNERLPLLQFRKSLKKGTHLKIYSRDEILSHEAIHAARVAFDEPVHEEIFAYGSSNNFFRRQLGPLIRKPLEIMIFFLLVMITMSFQLLSLLSYDPIFVLLFKISLAGAGFYLTMGIFRLAKTNYRLKKTYKKLEKLLGKSSTARAVVFRLTDREIYKFSKMKVEEIKNYSLKQKEKELRWKVLWLAYFHQKSKPSP